MGGLDVSLFELAFRGAGWEGRKEGRKGSYGSDARFAQILQKMLNFPITVFCMLDVGSQTTSIRRQVKYWTKWLKRATRRRKSRAREAIVAYPILESV